MRIGVSTEFTELCPFSPINRHRYRHQARERSLSPSARGKGGDDRQASRRGQLSQPLDVARRRLTELPLVIVNPAH
jgi:hypothetical protein